ncbi:PH domain-containing protein [Microbacterium sp.]|uniref:PH domain-containing protein n=1 Tax=Microbacterium sp. TaxID=51671 RepID=UPI003A866D47
MSIHVENELRRLPARTIVAGYLGHAPSIVTSVLGLWVFVTRPDVWPGQWAAALFGAFILFRIVDPVYEYATVRYRSDPDVIVLRHGLISRHTRSLRWSDVTALQAEETWSLRPFRLTRVTVLQGGEESAQLVLPAVLAPELDRLRSFAPRNATSKTSGATEYDTDDLLVAERGPDRDEQLIYRATLTQLLIAALVYGQFALLGVALGYALFELLDTFELTDGLLALAAAGPWVFGVFLGLIVIAGGFASTLVRYGRFQVWQRDDGSIRIAYGLLTRRDRRIDASAIEGIVVHRNLVEILLGRARMSILSTDSARQLGGNLVIPSLTRGIVADIAQRSFPAHVDDVTLLTRPGAAWRSLGAALTVVVPACGAAWGFVTMQWPLLLAVVAALIVARTLLGLGRVVGTRLRMGERGMVALTTHHASERQVVLRALAVHWLSSWDLFGRPRLAAVHYYAGRPHRGTAVRLSELDVARLQGRIAERGPRITQVRSARRAHAARRARIAQLVDEAP